jgi:integrase/recombinase XerD
METNNILTQFISNLETQKRSNSTIVAYKKDISQLFEYLTKLNKNFEISAIKTSELEGFLNELKNSGQFTLKTISRKINSIKTFFKYLTAEKLVKEDVSSSIKHPKVDTMPPRYLSPLEYRSLRDVSRNNIRLYTMVEMLLQTGITIGELSRLKRDDVSIQKDGIYLKIESYSTKSERKIKLNEIIANSLKLYLDKVKETPGGHLFYTKTGHLVLIRNIRTAVNRAFRKAGIVNSTVNDIRNTFIVYQLENGMDISELAKYVGHQKSTTTERYLSLVENRPSKTTRQIKSL